MKNIFILTLALGLLVCFSGCASVIAFKSPREFKDGKFKEDPPL